MKTWVVVFEFKTELFSNIRDEFLIVANTAEEAQARAVIDGLGCVSGLVACFEEPAGYNLDGVIMHREADDGK